MESTTEIEAKFDAEPDWQLPDLGELVSREVRATELIAVYWDTADRRLDASGVTLRRRVADEVAIEWTVKLPMRASADGVQHRQEVTVDGDGDGEAVPAELRDLLRAMTLGAELAPMAELRTDRRRLRVGDDLWTDAVEITDDRVTSQVDGRPGPSFRQIEVELLDLGAHDVMDAVVEVLRGAGLESSSDASKLRRVIGSSGGDHGATSGTASTVEQLTAASIGRCLAEMVAADPWIRLDDDAEVVHTCRKAIRRLRSDLKSLRPALDRSRTDPLRDELRWYGGLLGDVRDRHVMGEHVADLADEVGIAVGELDDVIEVLESQQAIERRNVLSAIGGDRYLALLSTLAEFERSVPLRPGVDPDEPARKFVAKAGRSSLKKVERTRRRAVRQPTAVHLHEMRKKVKDARAAGQLAKDAGMKAAEFVRVAGDLKEDLGGLHDADVLVAWLDELSGRLDPGIAYRAGQIRQRMVQRRSELEVAWPEAWERLDNKRLRRWTK